ncbi:858_t:CDS:1, partial [Funneliformis caledonium]
PNEHEDGFLEFKKTFIGTSQYKVPLEEANEKVSLLDLAQLQYKLEMYLSD